MTRPAMNLRMVILSVLWVRTSSDGRAAEAHFQQPQCGWLGRNHADLFLGVEGPACGLYPMLGRRTVAAGVVDLAGGFEGSTALAYRAPHRALARWRHAQRDRDAAPDQW